MTPMIPTLPTLLPVGNGAIRLEQDDPFTLDFLSGLTAGHLTYMAYCKNTQLVDTDILHLIVQHQENAHTSLSFNAGFVTGFLSTMTKRHAFYILTSDAFCEGYQEGLKAYCQLGQHSIPCIHELCLLLSWKHPGNGSAFRAGYMAGYIQGLTQGIHAILRPIRGSDEPPPQRNEPRTNATTKTRAIRADQGKSPPEEAL